MRDAKNVNNDRRARTAKVELMKARSGFAERMRIAFDGANNAEIARRCETQRNVIKEYSDGSRLPMAEMLLRMRRATGVSIDWLLTGKGEKYISINDGLFTPAEEQSIRQLAIESGRTFEQQVRLLAVSGAKFLRSSKQ